MPLILEISGIIAPLFFIAGIGYVWGNSGRPFDTTKVSMLCLNFGVPALIFSTLTGLEISLTAFGNFIGIFAIFIAANLVIGAILLRAFHLEIPAFLPALAFPNNGNLGLPLCLFAFGSDGLAFGISVFVIMSTVNIIMGFAFASGVWSFKSAFRTPLLWVIGVALIFVFVDEPPPKWLANTAELIGSMSIPLMLIALGVSLSRLEVVNLKQSFWLGLARILIGFCLGIFLSTVFGLQGPARGVLILQCTMPPAVLNYIFAVRFDREPSAVAGIIVASTLMSFVTLPLLMLVVLSG